MSESSRFETIAAVRFGSFERPILAKATFRFLSGLAVCTVGSEPLQLSD